MVVKSRTVSLQAHPSRGEGEGGCRAPWGRSRSLRFSSPPARRRFRIQVE
jgi:hypothetical protein